MALSIEGIRTAWIAGLKKARFSRSTGRGIVIYDRLGIAEQCPLLADSCHRVSAGFVFNQ